MTQDETEREANEAAQLLPMTSDDEKPCLQVAGAQVYAYVEDGVLVVSVDLDTADKAVFAMYGDSCVPVRVSVGGEEVFTAGPSPAKAYVGRRRSV